MSLWPHPKTRNPQTPKPLDPASEPPSRCVHVQGRKENSDCMNKRGRHAQVRSVLAAASNDECHYDPLNLRFCRQSQKASAQLAEVTRHPRSHLRKWTWKFMAMAWWTVTEFWVHPNENHAGPLLIVRQRWLEECTERGGISWRSQTKWRSGVSSKVKPRAVIHFMYIIYYIHII